MCVFVCARVCILLLTCVTNVNYRALSSCQLIVGREHNSSALTLHCHIKINSTRRHSNQVRAGAGAGAGCVVAQKGPDGNISANHLGHLPTGWPAVGSRNSRQLWTTKPGSCPNIESAFILGTWPDWHLQSK